MILCKCPECGNAISNEAEKCPYCGFPPTTVCTKCFSLCHSWVMQCPACGRRLHGPLQIPNSVGCVCFILFILFGLLICAISGFGEPPKYTSVSNANTPIDIIMKNGSTWFSKTILDATKIGEIRLLFDIKGEKKWYSGFYAFVMSQDHPYYQELRKYGAQIYSSLEEAWSRDESLPPVKITVPQLDISKIQRNIIGVIEDNLYHPGSIIDIETSSPIRIDNWNYVGTDYPYVYKIYARIRAKNMLGGYVWNSYWFILDENGRITKAIDAED